MKTVIVNGSPQGNDSITLYTMLYIEKNFPDIEFEILQPGRQIRKMEQDFSQCRASLESADLIIFCYPVYTFLVPSQLHRFIELMKENDVKVEGKTATQVTTSLHFYDITAHRFIEENCKDLGMKYIRGLSADMEDLLKEKGRKEALAFFRFVLWNMEGSRVPAQSSSRIALVADRTGVDGTLGAMIARFKETYPGDVSITDKIGRAHV